MNVENSILTIRVADDIFEKINGGKSLHHGIETAYAFSNVIQSINLKGAYTYAMYRSLDFPEKYFLPGTPQHILYNRLTYTISNAFDFHLTHQWISKVFLTDLNDVETEGNQLINIGMDVKIPFKNQWEIILSANLHNLLDERYSSMYQINAPSAGGALPRYYYPGKPRSFYFDIKSKHSF